MVLLSQLCLKRCCNRGGFSYIETRRFTLTVVLTRLGEIPVPIPNTEVKSKPVDDT